MDIAALLLRSVQLNKGRRDSEVSVDQKENSNRQTARRVFDETAMRA